MSPAPFASLNMSVSTGDSAHNVQSNRRLFFEQMGVSPDRVISAHLTHGSDVTVFRRDAVAPRTRDESPATFKSDAVISTVPGRFFTMTFADCVPLILFDPVKRAVGAIHAGWRGTAAEIAMKTVVRMQRVVGSDPRDIRVGIGPSIGPCCYHVGRDVALEVGLQEAVREQDGRLYLDLWECNRRQLVGAGVAAENIVVSAICTSCSVADYYSHRAESGRTGRFALCVGLP